MYKFVCGSDSIKSFYFRYLSLTVKMAGVRTRHSSESKLVALLGSGRDLLPSELPTLRAALRLGIKYTEEKQTRNEKYPIQELALDVAKAVEAQWLKANCELIPPKICTLKSMQRNIEKQWRRAQDIVWDREKKKAVIQAYQESLDKLYDITKCHCKIQPCSVNPPCMDPHTGKKCKQGAHISCTCPKKEKLPKLELLFIHSQREKTGDKGGMRIGNQDFPESHRQDAYMKRKHAEDQGTYTAKKTAAEYKKLLEEVPSRIEEGPEDVYVESELNTGKDLPIKKRNTLDITGLASTALRFEVSNREATACATAFLGDLIKGGHISPEAAYLAVDPAKVQRARDALIVKATFSRLEDLEQDKSHCLLFLCQE